jgi:predicted negative regulator of RcsB-dependent stress response
MSDPNISPIVETTEPVDVIGVGGDATITKDVHNSTYKIMLIGVVVIVLLFVVWHSYSCFTTNQLISFPETYVNEQPRTDPQSDDSFDVNDEIKKLIQLQENHLGKIRNN